MGLRLGRHAPRFTFALWCAVSSCGSSGGADLFRVAAEGVPGGSLFSVWGVQTLGASSPARGFIAGGYVGVPHATVPDGRVGRLVEYTASDFRTVCTTDEVLWWVTGIASPLSGSDVTAYAVGEGGRVLRYRDGACTTLDTEALRTPAGAPTFYGAVALAPDDLWLVGGSASPGGPKGVLVHYDGRTFERVEVPAPASEVDLFKIDRAPDNTLVVVGARNTVLERAPSSPSFTPVQVPVRADDNRLFTVSCLQGPLGIGPEGVECVAVGGAGRALVLTRRAGRWQSNATLGFVTFDEQPGLNGVAMLGAEGAYLVGVGGVTIHTTFGSAYVPPRARTAATLHGVGGSNGHVVAVGGELGVATAAQRGVVLVRSPSYGGTFRFDGVEYPATGDLRTSLGGAGQGGSPPSQLDEGSACQPSRSAQAVCREGLSCVTGADPDQGVCRASAP